MRSSVPAHPNFNCQTLPPQDQISTRPGHRFRTNTTRMAQSFSFQQQQGGDIGIQQQKITIPNNRGEKLVGILLETGSRELVVICHGFQSSKEGKTIASVAAALTREGISTFRFDFSGNGESEGSFQYGNYREEADDLHAVVLYFSGIKREISAIIGHSKGGNVVVLYASMYHDVPMVVNVSGRFNLERGIEDRLGKDFMQRIKNDGFIDVKDEAGNVEFRVTEESLMDRLNTDMRAACLSIDKDCRVLTVHGSEDEIIPVEDASEFAKLIPNHKLHILEGANHGYNSHRDELASIVLDFLRESVKQDAH
ncbi:uncharacterized protein LOC131222731 isoform X1 [Magnolia sinica]|uniref:uncharacterized protein LOC131222731 isoform X1 n=1 Tax=Magnolia sinica TaxID=86752 RepID=UPI0026586C27|nr:uncharacterized protein LOC131222731 isoform X1 [Magnolia sinica]XP_058073881.1 uncharacterized protein LOC131222731 isoform X1 [Magnolia sinica]